MAKPGGLDLDQNLAGLRPVEFDFHDFERFAGLIIKGIGKFSLGQVDLAAKIDAARAEMDSQMAKEAPDYDRVDALEEQIDWDQRIFTDRQQTIRYLCETPQLLEQRLYAIAQLLQEAGSAEGGDDG
ncbi:hypothetical protein [Salipiger sp. H15]|uniref:hypothetical protein n=1 Tax=Alloyangia sp. H15 TaxID=3029062 RepID=UPI003364B691